MNVKNNLVAKRYSDALLDLIKENSLDLNNINVQLKSIQECFVESSDFYNFILNPIISSDDKKDLIDSVFKEKVDETLINFLKLLIDKNRFSTFNEIVETFNNEVLNINNIKIVSVTSAIELSDALKQRLIEKLSSKLNKNVELIQNVEPDIIAGMIIKIDDNIIDMSLKHRFEEMKKQMTK